MGEKKVRIGEAPCHTTNIIIIPNKKKKEGKKAVLCVWRTELSEREKEKRVAAIHPSRASQVKAAAADCIHSLLSFLSLLCYALYVRI